MKRKVIQLAGKTYVITLPTAWVNQWGIKKGEEIEMTEHGPRLIVSTGESREMKKGEVDVSNASERTLRWLLSSLHKKGFDEIEVKTNNPAHFAVIDELVKDLLLGFAVVERTNSKCVIRSLSKELDNQLQVIVRRAFLITLQMADQLAELIKKKSFTDAKAVIELEKTNNQLTNFCERIINKRGLDEPVKNSFLYVIMWNLEKIGDEFKYLAEHTLDRKKTSKESLIFLERANKLLRDYYELFYAFDVKKLSDLSDSFKLLTKDIREIMPKHEDSVALSHVLHVVMKSADLSASTFALNS